MIVVTGATGNVGRALVRMLAEHGARVRATSRGITAADVPGGVEARRADLLDVESLRAVFEGAQALFLHDGAATARLIDPHKILELAAASGVRRVVLLSSQGVVTRPDSESHGRVAHGIEEAVRGSGLAWTILRPSGFDSNTYAWAEQVRTTRTVAAPFGDVGLPTVDPADIAAVAAAVLEEDADGDGGAGGAVPGGGVHAGQVYELTGPAAVSPREQAEAIGAAIGEAVRFVELTRAQARAHMLRFLPEPVADTTLDILGEPTPRERRVSPDVERVLGRPPRAYADWARENAVAFR